MTKRLLMRILIGAIILLTLGAFATPFVVSSHASIAMLITAVAIAVFLVAQIYFEDSNRELATLLRAGLLFFASLFWLPIIVVGQTRPELVFSLILYASIVITVLGALVVGLISSLNSTRRTVPTREQKC